MREIYARFNSVNKKTGYPPELRSQIFTQTWAGVTDMTEILKLRCDDEQYFEGVNSEGEAITEAFFTAEEAVVLKEKFPESFQVLVYA